MTEKPFETNMKTESILIMPLPYTKSRKQTCHFILWGKVMRIDHFEKYDLVMVRTGFLSRKTRTIIVVDNHARRQILTLKKGCVVEIYGIGTMFYLKNGRPDSKNPFFKKWYFNALGFNCWYVPSAYDFKKMQNNTEILEEMEETPANYDESVFEDIVNKLLDKGDNDD